MGFFFDLMKCFKSKFLADDWIILLKFDTAYALVTRIFRNYTNKYTLLLLPSWMLGTEMDALCIDRCGSFTAFSIGFTHT